MPLEHLVPLSSVHLAREARCHIVEMAHRSGWSHVGSSLSVVDIVSVLYCTMKLGPQYFGDFARGDHVIFSKGHAASALYSVLALQGHFPLSWLRNYGADGSNLSGHVTAGVPGVLFSSGSLGHGLPVALGIALSLKDTQPESKIFVVMSDGELDEGTTWESLLIASHHSLSNLVVLIDRNRLQSLASTEDTLALEPLTEKAVAFGWNCVTISGHSHSELEAIATRPNTSGRPTFVICETTKGKGVSFMEDKVLWHYRSPNSVELKQALLELRKE